MLFRSYKYAITGTLKKNNALKILQKKLDLFTRFNIKFGRKYIKFLKKEKCIFTCKQISTQKNKKYPQTISFNDKYMNFYKKYIKGEIPEISQQIEDDYYDVINVHNRSYFENDAYNIQNRGIREMDDFLHIFQIIGRTYNPIFDV